MEQVVNEQLKELRSFMPLTELQVAYIKASLEIAYAEGEANQMRKEIKKLRW